MNTSSVYIHSISALNSSGASPVLREGSSVLVRVIAQQSDGRYAVSFSGSRFSVVSEHPLQTGTFFKAEVAVRNGKVVLIPQKSTEMSPVTLKNFTSESSSLFAPLQDLQLSSYFSLLGLVPDTLTMRLFQQMQQLGVKIDAGRLLKARSAALRFSGKEASAAEASLLLEEKGIESTDAAVADILSGGEQQEKNENPSRHKDTPKKNCFAKSVDGENSILSIFKSSSSIYSENRRSGVLTLFNHLKNTDDSAVHWIVLPFQMHFAKDAGRGMLRICLDINKKSVIKMIISADNCGQEYTFVLYFNIENKKCKKVLFSIQPSPAIGIRKMKELLSNLLSLESLSDVEWAEDGITPFDTENLPLSFVEGCV